MGTGMQKGITLGQVERGVLGGSRKKQENYMRRAQPLQNGRDVSVKRAKKSGPVSWGSRDPV